MRAPLKYGCMVCGWTGPVMDMIRTDDSILCPKCRSIKWLMPDDITEPERYAKTHRPVIEKARILREEMKLPRPQWLSVWERRVWKSFKTDGD